MRIVKLSNNEYGFFHWWPVLIWNTRPNGYTLIIAIWGWALILVDIDFQPDT